MDVRTGNLKYLRQTFLPMELDGEFHPVGLNILEKFFPPSYVEVQFYDFFRTEMTMP